MELKIQNKPSVEAQKEIHKYLTEEITQRHNYSLEYVLKNKYRENYYNVMFKLKNGNLGWIALIRLMERANIKGSINLEI